MLKKYQKYLGLSFLVVVTLFSVVYSKEAGPSHLLGTEIGQEQEELAVNFLNIGQGDAIYIRTPDDVDVLIDGGPDKSILNELGAVMPFWDKEINLMILTHPHSDHVGGLVEVLRRYKVNKILYTGVLHTAPDYLAWLNEIKGKKVPLEIVDKKSEIKLGDYIQLKLLYPQKSFLNQKVKELNNTSIVAQLVYGQTSFLLTGDAEEEVEKELLADHSIALASNVLKVGHHGSESSTSIDFLRAVSPKIAVIQVGTDNSFNHPHGKTLFNLKNAVEMIFRTDNLGRVKLLSDGVGGIAEN